MNCHTEGCCNMSHGYQFALGGLLLLSLVLSIHPIQMSRAPAQLDDSRLERPNLKNVSSSFAMQPLLCRNAAMRFLHSSMDAEDQVIVTKKTFTRIVELNRPPQLNALSYQMTSHLLDLLACYEDDPNVRVVVVKGRGRAFSAGGDLLAFSLATDEGDWKACDQFLRKLYTLVYRISISKKSWITIIDGIIMGAGAGISVHGKFRVATENTVFAMPEVHIGAFPDVGASYFLPRLPGFFGEFCGLTGARLDGADMLVLGLATHFVPAAKLPLLEEALSVTEIRDPTEASAVLDQFCEQVAPKDESALHRMECINNCFSKETMEEIISALERVEENNSEGWATMALESLKRASPTSLKLSLRSIRQGRYQNLRECLIREFRIACHIFRKDGCRAVLLRKDRSAKWEPFKLDLVSEELVEKFFSRIDDWGDLDLQFQPVPTVRIAFSNL